jgi:acetylserotonin O-methyltransferase
VAEERIEKSGLGDRIGVHAGDFFTDPLPAADLYALGRVLHDWREDTIRLLLRRIFDRLVGAQMQSLSMLVCTEGRERTFSEYRELLMEAGFTKVEGKRTGKYLDAILALKLTQPECLPGPS